MVQDSLDDRVADFEGRLCEIMGIVGAKNSANYCSYLCATHEDIPSSYRLQSVTFNHNATAMIVSRMNPSGILLPVRPKRSP